MCPADELTDGRTSGWSKSQKLSAASSEELRALALIDYENVRLGARSRFANNKAVDQRVRSGGRFDFHPWKLGEVICDVLSRQRSGRKVKLVEVRVYCAEALDGEPRKRQQSQKDAWRYPPGVDLDAVKVVVVDPPRQRAHEAHPTMAERKGNVEKEIDTSMAVDLVVGAASRSTEFDIAILFSHDSDLIPAVEDTLERESDERSLEVHCAGWEWKAEDLEDVAEEKTPLRFRLPKGRLHYLTAVDYSVVADGYPYQAPMDELRDCHRDGRVVFGRVVGTTRQGIEVEVKGTKGLVSAGDVETVDFGPAIERTRQLQGDRPLQLVVHEIDPKRRHANQRVRLAELATNQDRGLEPQVGRVSRGHVALTLECGVLVDCGAFNCFVPYGELAYGDTYEVGDVAVEDQHVEVLCYSGANNGEVRFSMRRAMDLVVDRLNSLREGDVLIGRRVSRVRRAGIFVDLGDVDGFVPERLLRRSSTNDIEQRFHVGEELDVQVTKVDKTNRQVQLALPQTSEQVEQRNLALRMAGQVVPGTVKAIAHYGAFVDLDDHIDGLVHVSDLADHRVHRVSDVVRVGDVIPVKIVLPTADSQGIRLSLKDARSEATEAGWEFGESGGIERVPEEIAAELGMVELGHSYSAAPASGDEADGSAGPPPAPGTTAMQEALQRAEAERRDRASQHKPAQTATVRIAALMRGRVEVQLLGTDVLGMIAWNQIADHRIDTFKKLKRIVHKGDIIPTIILDEDRDTHPLRLSLSQARSSAEEGGWMFDSAGRIVACPLSVVNRL